jgi:hypothetical protein
MNIGVSTVQYLHMWVSTVQYLLYGVRGSGGCVKQKGNGLIQGWLC